MKFNFFILYFDSSPFRAETGKVWEHQPFSKHFNQCLFQVNTILKLCEDNEVAKEKVDSQNWAWKLELKGFIKKNGPLNTQ